MKKEWEIPMELSDKERKLYKMTEIDYLNNNLIRNGKNERTIHENARGKLSRTS